MSMPYEKARPRAQEWTDKAHGLAAAGKIKTRREVKSGVTTVFLDGICPRCGDALSQAVERTAVIVRRAGPDAVRVPAAAEPVFQTFFCDCGEEHDGRPSDEQGCGIQFNAWVDV